MLLCENNGQLKLGDFGYSTQSFGKKGDGIFTEAVGTSVYMAPEIYSKNNYNAISGDIFALGVCLFAMATIQHPFIIADASDARYKCIMDDAPG